MQGTPTSVSSSLITSCIFLWVQVLQQCEQAGCCNKYQGTQQLIVPFPHVARQEVWGVSNSTDSLTSAQNTVPPHCYFHCHARVLLKGVPVADCLQSLLQGQWNLQLIWHSRTSRELSVDKIAAFMGHTFQCHSVLLTTISAVTAPASSAVSWVTARLDVLFWRSLLLPGWRACSLSSLLLKRSPPFWPLCFFFAFHLWATPSMPALWMHVFKRFSQSQKRSVLFFPLCQARAVISRSHAGLATSGFL